MTKVAEADTEQARAYAQDDYNKFVKELNKQYGIKLSDNAKTAWDQLQNMFSGASAKGLANSGIFNEAMDKYLQDVRTTDQRNREAKITDEEKRKRKTIQVRLFPRNSGFYKFFSRK